MKTDFFIEDRHAMSSPDVVIVGAGPYGLSLAAHLRLRGVSFRIFGSPMSTWRNHMPTGMFLKSDGFASSLSDPNAEFTLKRYCAEEGIPYDDYRIPVSLDTFTAYGKRFQQLYVPDLEDKQVTAIDQTANGFRVRLDTGEVVGAQRVLLAVGITHFQYVPPELKNLPPAALSHSYAHREVGHFRGKDVTVIGAGASALNLADSLHEIGARVTVVARATSVSFHSPPVPGPRSLWQRLRHPSSGIGPGLQSKLFAEAPQLFHRLPQRVRVAIVRRHLGPAGGWTIKERVCGRVPMLLGYHMRTVEVRDGGVQLTLADSRGGQKKHGTEHVIAATGYRVDLGRLRFLSEHIRTQLASVNNTPVLSSDFQSTVAGLYFVGVAAANSFGPVLRFTFGADFAARRITEHVVRSLRQESPRPDYVHDFDSAFQGVSQRTARSVHGDDN